MDQNKQEQQHGDVMLHFYWLSDPEAEEAYTNCWSEPLIHKSQ